MGLNGNNRRNAAARGGRLASRYALRIQKEWESYSRLHKEQKESRQSSLSSCKHAEGDSERKPVHEVDSSTLMLGNLLGQGGFNEVFELRGVVGLDSNGTHELQKNGIRHENDEQHQVFNPSFTPKYAVKRLRVESMQDPTIFCDAAADLLMESKLLACLQGHPNIIRLHGVERNGAWAFRSGQFCLVMEMLHRTLGNALQEWRDGRSVAPVWGQRLQICVELASALEFIHSHNVIYRDLKPDNVGFSVSGATVLFDFGLATEVNPSKCIDTQANLYEMTGGTGSRRYLAPEVCRREPYGFGADTYSFFIVLHEILSLQRPFNDLVIYSAEQHMQVIVQAGLRPPIDPKWSPVLRELIKQGWKDNSCLRPSAKDTYQILSTLASTTAYGRHFQLPSISKTGITSDHSGSGQDTGFSVTHRSDSCQSYQIAITPMPFRRKRSRSI